VNKDQCKSEISGVVTGCFWLFSSNDTGVNDGACRANDGDQLGCSEIKRSTQCVSGVSIKCVWMEEEEIHCQDVKSVCVSLETEPSCEDVSGNKCVWVETEADGHRCQETQDSCIKITTEATCLFEGAAISGFGTVNEKNISCIWVLGNTSSSSTPTSTCVSKVCR
jgi:hypothetical protein